MTNTYVHEDLQQLIERLKPVHHFLEQNHYVKYTSMKLKRIMDDAQTNTTVLLMGKERVGKTSVINSLLNRKVLPSSTQNPTKVNTFVKYSEKEYINAVFLDGVEITFDLNKLPLLVVGDTESAQIIREHIAYIEIYLAQPTLKNITLIDSTAIESSTSGSAYFSPTLLERVDEIFWVIRAGSPLTEVEVELLQKLVEAKQKPHIIINAIDEYDGALQTFIEQEQQRYGELVRSFMPISAELALQAMRENDSQKLIDSNATQLSQFVQSLCEQPQKKVNHTMERLLQWMKLFALEMQQLPFKEPLESALKTVQRFNVEHMSGSTKDERDRVIIEAYREEYEEVSQVFEQVDTLYRLLQKLASTFYLRDEEVELFEELAFAYQQNVRDYRKVHTEYTQLYSKVEANYRKSFKKYLQQWSPTESNEQITAQIDNLKSMYNELKDLYTIIAHQQKMLLQNFDVTQSHLIELAQKRMRYILKQLAELDQKRQIEVVHLQSYDTKIKEFTCIEQAKQHLVDACRPYVMNDMTVIDDALKQQFEQVFKELDQTKLLLDGVFDESVFTEPVKTINPNDFETQYTLTPLSLTEADIISEIPELPSSV